MINLRTLRPLDFDTVAESIRKTRRCITVETGWPVCGIGAEIAARVFEWGVHEQLLAPVIRVTGLCQNMVLKFKIIQVRTFQHHTTQHWKHCPFHRP